MGNIDDRIDATYGMRLEVSSTYIARRLSTACLRICIPMSSEAHCTP